MLIVILVVMFFVVYLIIYTKINKLRDRASAHVLGKIGLGGANFNQKFNQVQESKHLKKLLVAHPNLTEKIVKDTMYSYAVDINSCVTNNHFSEKTINQMNSKELIKKMNAMRFERVNIVNYRNSSFAAIAVFTDGRDEYQLSLYCTIKADEIYVDSIDAMKGLMKGF